MTADSFRSPLSRTCDDVIVVGSGAAGLTFALEASKYLRVTVLTKDQVRESNTRWAQGGLAAALHPDDDYHRHIRDTLVAGGEIGNLEAVTILIHEAPARVRDLQHYGVSFDIRADEGLLFTREGGHSKSRIVHVGDLTGMAIEEALVNQVRLHPRITVHEHTLAIDVVVREGRAYGVTFLDQHGQRRFLLGRVVVLATGGAGQLYPLSTNPHVATGDGIAMGLRAGATLRDMEFMQFHPTVFSKEGAPVFLITEALRGEGALLLSHDGRRIMEGLHPDLELAPRDVVSRAIYLEMQRTGQPCAYLDISHKPAEWFRQRFPYVNQRCLENGVDPTREPMPVAPAAHYFCGGVATDIDARTSIRGLYACGETACTGVHGGNRLASNSLLEALVFGYRGAIHAERYIQYLAQDWYDRADALLVEQNHPAVDPRPAAPLAAVRELRSAVQECMARYAGIVRSQQGLALGMERMEQLVRQILALEAEHAPDIGLLEVKNLAQVAAEVLRFASLRRENIGTHYITEPTGGELVASRLAGELE